MNEKRQKKDLLKCKLKCIKREKGPGEDLVMSAPKLDF